LDVNSIVIVDSFRVFEQLLQIRNILLDNVCYVIKLSELVAIVIFEHAFWTDELMAVPAEVLNLPLLMLVTENVGEVRDFCVDRFCGENHVLRAY
jgi:hypothetical protein